MAKKGAVVAVVLLRFLTLGVLAGSIVVLATDTFTLSDGTDTTKTTFKDVITYRFVLAAACVGAFYTLIQIPFAIYYASKEKRLSRNECLPEFDFIGDKVIAFLLAIAAGAGFAVTYEFKKLLSDIVEGLQSAGVTGLEEAQSKANEFLDKAYIAVGLLFIGFLSMALLSVCSSIHRSSDGSRWGFFK